MQFNIISFMALVEKYYDCIQPSFCIQYLGRAKDVDAILAENLPFNWNLELLDHPCEGGEGACIFLQLSGGSCLETGAPIIWGLVEKYRNLIPRISVPFRGSSKALKLEHIPDRWRLVTHHNEQAGCIVTIEQVVVGQ